MAIRGGNKFSLLTPTYLVTFCFGILDSPIRVVALTCSAIGEF